MPTREVLEITVAVRLTEDNSDLAMETATAAMVEARKRLLEIPGAKRFTSSIAMRRALKTRSYRRRIRRRHVVDDDPIEGKPN